MPPAAASRSLTPDRRATLRAAVLARVAAPYFSTRAELRRWLCEPSGDLGNRTPHQRAREGAAGLTDAVRALCSNLLIRS